jgi:hypothetical protein
MSMPTKSGLVFLGFMFAGSALLAGAGAQYLTIVSAHSHLQEVADEAAISGVLALASNNDRGSAAAQHKAAMAAGNIVTNRINGAWVSITPGDDLTLSVRISAPQQPHVLGWGEPVEVVGTARYIPPEQEQYAQASQSLPSE